jgi:vacuolar protein sorting-associated protein 13A/C
MLPFRLQSPTVMSPYQSILYTWEDPCKERTLQWNASNATSNDVPFCLWRDGYGVQRIQLQSDLPPTSPPANVQTSTNSMSSKITAGLRRLSKPSFDANAKVNGSETEDTTNELFVYWVSFLDSGQRVLLLTTDADTALRTKNMIDPENGSFELLVAVTGVGLSLATDPAQPTQELAYVSAQESAPSWEVLVSRGWCPMPFELATWCEENYLKNEKTAKLKTLMHVDFEKMQLIKPFFAEIRRIQNPAIWLQYRRSPRQVYLHCKLHHLQVS